jgi:hypothetical protein
MTHVSGVIGNAKDLLQSGSDPLQRPAVVPKAESRCPARDQLRQPGKLVITERGPLSRGRTAA